MKHRPSRRSSALRPDPLWFRDAVIYELPVRAYYDSNGDGVGDFTGLIDKLDYLQDLGVTALWILPFYPSPLRDGGYDIADYCSVDPDYGTLRDFKRLLEEAHRRELRIITELVINHTSAEHPWFQRARRSPKGSKHRDFYVFSDTADRYADARIIFQDFETSNWTWDPVAKAYYWHRFYSHQPDLNFDNPAVHRAVIKALDFWLDMGVDGLRLDAIPYLYEAEGTNCENLPETHAFLKKLRAHVDAKYSDRMLLAEANQWPEDAAAYFGDGDECHMNFHFPLMPRMFMGVELENSFPIIDILQQTPQLPETCQWATFLRNHDELTLEMVTDEDRDYMYQTYAQDPRARVNLGIRRRLAPLLGVRRKVELMNGLLFSLPGTPVVYYGDEIGMGDNIYLGDRDGVRTPMQWSGDRNAGFSRANPQRLFLPTIIDPEYHFEAVNVEAQQNNAASLLWWMKRIIAVRKEHPVFGRGTITFLSPENARVLAYVREHEGALVLVVANLSRFAQHADLDLRAYAGRVPIELFGRVEFPVIHDRPYSLALGPHGFYWFSLDLPQTGSLEEQTLPELSFDGSLAELLEDRRQRRALHALLPDYIASRRWYRTKTRRIKGATISDVSFLPGGEGSCLTIAAVELVGGRKIREYVLPLAIVDGEVATHILEEHPHSILARLEGATPRLLVDGTATAAFGRALLALFTGRKQVELASGQLEPRTHLKLEPDAGDEPRLAPGEQTNTSIFYGDRFVVKLYRLLESGPHPETEVGLHLTGRFANAAPLYGQLTRVDGRGGRSLLALLQGFVPNHGDAWSLVLDAARRFYENLIANSTPSSPPPAPDGKVLGALTADGTGGPDAFLGLVRLLGKRTAELHHALCVPSDNEALAPEPYSVLHQRSLYQSTRGALSESFDMLRKALPTLPPETLGAAASLLEHRAALDAKLRTITRHKIDVLKIRGHGDYHLGQVLHSGADFIIVDFEGEPARPMGERRIKRTALRDIAGMLRSFHYAAVVAITEGGFRQEDRAVLEPWAAKWANFVGAAFLEAYLRAAEGADFLPDKADDLHILLLFSTIEKCLYELRYELDHRPTWVGIPIAGLLALASDE